MDAKVPVCRLLHCITQKLFSICFYLSSPLCKQEAAEDIWKIDEQPDVSDISFDVTVVNKTILQLSDVQLLLSSHLQYFKAAVLGNNLTKISWHKTNPSLKEHLLASKRNI